MKLSLESPNLTNDPLRSLKDLPNLLILCICKWAYKGESLHFQREGFEKLKQLKLHCLYNLKSIIIDRGALQSLKRLGLMNIRKLKAAPSGIQHLKKLEVLNIWLMPTEFDRSIVTNGGQAHWII